MAREYVVSTGGITVANAAVTLVFINPGTTQSIEILRCWAAQSASTTSAQQRIQMVTQPTTFPVCTAATPRKLKLIDPASVIVACTGGQAVAAGQAGVNASGEGSGTKVVLFEDVFNVLNGWQWIATPTDTIVVNASAASGFGLYLPAAAPVATQTGWSFGVVYREL